MLQLRPGTTAQCRASLQQAGPAPLAAVLHVCSSSSSVST